MEIILSILLILGIAFLVIIGLILMILFIVLFVPIRYRVFGEVQDTIFFNAKVSWLLHMIRAKATYEDELFNIEFEILWKRISRTKEIITPSNESLNEDTSETETKLQSEESHETEDSKQNKYTQKHSNIFNKFLNRINKLKEKILYIKEKWCQIKQILQDKKNQEAFRHIKDELIFLVKICLPKKSQLNGVFSTGSPDTTGQLYGMFCCFPIMYQDNWNLIPDFETEKAYFKGEFQGKGRIYIYRLVGILIRIIIDKNCRRLYYYINRLGGQNNGRRK